MRGLLEKKQELMRRLAAASDRRNALRSESVASKGLSVYVSGLESTLAGTSTSVDSKEVARGEKDSSRTANFDAVRRRQGRPVSNQIN